MSSPPAGSISGVTIVFVPYHQDERLSAEQFPLPTGASVSTVAPQLPDGDRWQRIVALNDATADTVAATIQGGAMPTVVSGDCLSALGTVTGAQRAGVDPAVVWFDAHGDLHTVGSSTSGYLGGMALRSVLGDQPPQVAGGLGLRAIPQRRVLLVDARDLDPAEADYLAGADVRSCAVPDVDARTLPDGPLVLHVDLDVIDAAELPDLLFPVGGGPSRTAVLDAVRRVLATGRVAAFSIACPWRPVGDEENARRAALLAGILA